MRSEQEKNLSKQIKAVELIGDLLVERKKYTDATKTYACGLALLSSTDSSRQCFFAKMKEAERAFLAAHSIRMPKERLSTQRLQKLQSLTLTQIPPEFSEVKAKLVWAEFQGALSRKYLERAVDQLCLLYQVDPQQMKSKLQEIEDLIAKAEQDDPSHPCSIPKCRENHHER